MRIKVVRYIPDMASGAIHVARAKIVKDGVEAIYITITDVDIARAKVVQSKKDLK